MEKRNISISAKNGYTLEKVLKAKQYLMEIGQNRRSFPFEKLVAYYNDILGYNDSPSGCKCQAPKYYNGINNYYNFGKLTLLNNGLATEADFEEQKAEPQAIENEANRIVLGASEAVSGDEVEDTKVEENNEAEEPKKKRSKKNVED